MDTIKKISFILFLLLAVVPFYGRAQQPNPQLVFDQANKQFKNGNIYQSIKLYHSLEERQQVSGALFLNMALNYIRLDSMGMAKYYFLKAAHFEETAPEASKGLQFVENQFSHQSVILPKLPWEQALNWLKKAVGSATLLGIAIILLNLGIFALIGTWFMKQASRKWQIIAITIAGLGLVMMALSFYVDYRTERYSRAVMVTAQTSIRKKPEMEAPVVNKAYAGYTFTVDHKKTRNHGPWTYVRMSNGLYGWIHSSEIRIL